MKFIKKLLLLCHLQISLSLLFTLAIGLALPKGVMSTSLIFSREPVAQLTLDNTDIIQSIHTTSQYIYLSINKKGIWIYDWAKRVQISQLVIPNSPDVPVFTSTSDNSKVYCIANSYIFAFNLVSTTTSNSQNLSLNQIQSSPQIISSAITKMILDRNGQHIFIYGGTQFAMFNASTLQKLDLVDLSQTIVQMRLSYDGNYLFLLSLISGKYNVRIFQITSSSTFNEIGRTALFATVYDFEITHDCNWIYGIDKRNQVLLITNIASVFSNTNQVTIIPTWTSYWPFNIISPIIFSFKFTLDDHYFLIGIRSVGIVVLDATNKMAPVWYYQISFSNIPAFFSFNGSQQDQIVVSDSLVLMYFTGETLNLNANIPNLFNLHKAQLISLPLTRRCLSINNGNNMLVSQQIKGLTLLKFYNPSTPNQVQSSAQIAQPNVAYWDIVFDSKTSTLYTTSSPTSNNILNFFTLTYGDSVNPPQMSFQSSTPNPSNTAMLQMVNLQRSKDGNLILQSFGNGFLLFDSSNYPTLKYLSANLLLPQTVHQADFTKDNKWIICTQRTNGYYGVVDISNLNNIVLKNLWRTSGVEGVVTSSVGNYAYLYDGSKGIHIIDTNALPQISILGSVQTNGWASYINLISNENYLIASTYSTDLAILVDISDKTNPVVVSKIQIDQENGYSVCVSGDEQTLFVLNGSGMRSIPINTLTQIHFQQNLYNPTSQQYSQIPNSSSLEIGQTYVIFFTPLYASNGQQIQEVSYYVNYAQAQLPPWIEFQQSQNSLIINASKEGLGTFTGSPPLSNQNMVLLTVQAQVKVTDFVFQQTLNGVTTTSAQSQSIFTQLQQSGFIVKDNYVPLTFFDSVSLLNIQLSGFTSAQLTLIGQLVQMKLQQTVEIIPLIFTIKQSLTLDFSNPSNIINTLSSSAQIIFSIAQNTGSFVKKTYKGVITSIDDTLTNLILEGSVSSLNQVLFEKILFYSTLSLNYIQVTIQTDDAVNFSQVTGMNLSDSRATFIQLKSPIYLNNPLQQQVNSIYPNQILYIQSTTALEFDQNTFIVSDPFYIEYSIFVKVNDINQSDTFSSQSNNVSSEQLKKQMDLGFILLPDSHWLKFDNVKLKLSGYATSSIYNNHYTFKIVASDGFTYAEDQFSVVVSGLPVSYVLLLILQVLGPIFSLFGIYKYRSFFYNYMYNRLIGSHYEEKIFVNQLYVKKIAIIGDELLKAQRLLESIVSVMRTHKDTIFFSGQKSSQILTQSGLQEDQASNKQKTIEEKNQFFKNQLCNSVGNIKDDSMLSIQKNISEKQRQSIINGFLQNVSACIEVDEKNKRQFQMEENKRISQAQINIGEKYSRKLALWLIQKKIIGFFTDPALKSISLDKIWVFLHQHKVCYIYNDQTITPQHYGQYIQDQASIFYYCFMGCFSDFLLKMDHISFLAYSSLMQLMQAQNGNDKMQWYDRYVKTTIQYSPYYEISTSPFPEVEFNEKLLRQDIDIFFKEGATNFDKEKLAKLRPQILSSINFNLMKEVIIHEKLGIIRRQQTLFKKQFTEYSLHVKPFQIDSIQCLKDEPAQKCYRLRKFLQSDKQNYTLQKNTNFLPNWMKLEIKNGNCIILYGIPTVFEQEKLHVRIYDQQQYIMCSFDLMISSSVLSITETTSPTIKLYRPSNFQSMRQKAQTNISPLLIRGSQLMQQEEISKKGSNLNNLTEDTNFKQSSQQIISKTRSVFQKLQTTNSSPFKPNFSTEQGSEGEQQKRKLTLFNQNNLNSTIGDCDGDENCFNLKEEDEPIMIYNSQPKQSKINDFNLFE